MLFLNVHIIHIKRPRLTTIFEAEMKLLHNIQNNHYRPLT